MFKFKYVTTLLFFIISVSSYSQIIIEDKIQINPDKQNVMNECEFDGCVYDFCDSTLLTLSFTPESIEPGEKTIMTLWVGSNQYFDTYNILQKTITLEPDYGSIVNIGPGEYEYTAPNEILGDTTLLVTVNYENYQVICWGIANDDFLRKAASDCYICSPYGQALDRRYGSGTIVIGWDSLDVKIEPSELYAGDTAQVIIKKRLPDGAFEDFPP